MWKRLRKNSTLLACRWALRLSGVAPSLAREWNFAASRLPRRRAFTRWLIEDLEERLPGFEQHLKLHVTGCPNSCGQHWISDIGIEGKKLKVDGQWVDAYYFCIGGAVGAFQSIARPLGYRCAATEVPAAIERLLRAYLAAKLPGENLRSFFGRHSDAELRGWLAGGEFEPVERDRLRGMSRREWRGSFI